MRLNKIRLLIFHNFIFAKMGDFHKCNLTSLYLVGHFFTYHVLQILERRYEKYRI